MSQGHRADIASPSHGSWQPPPRLELGGYGDADDGQVPVPRISLELSRQCNLSCIYCYSDAGPSQPAGLTDQEVRAVISEAVACGATMISIVGGGEPLLRPSLLVSGDSCIDYANGLGCYCCLYTNGTLLDSQAAHWLLQRRLTVVAKLNSLREDVQDALCGVPGSSVKMRRGIDALLAAGFAAGPPWRLGLENVICRQNYDELPDFWRWMRRRNIVPELEIPTQHGRAAHHRDAIFFKDDEAPSKYRALFEELLAIDRSEFGYDWVPHPPFVAAACRLYYSNCYINDRGGVQPCAGIDEEYGVLRVGARKARGQSLEQIVTGDDFRKLRRVRQHLEGACGNCELNRDCYGCRAAAWHKTGQIFSEDPGCWRKADAAASQDRS